MSKGFERGGQDEKKGAEVIRLDRIRKHEYSDGEVSQFADKIIKKYKDDTRCTPALIESMKAKHKEFLKADFKSILVDVIEDENRLESNASYYVTVAELYREEETNEKRINRADT